MQTVPKLIINVGVGKERNTFNYRLFVSFGARPVFPGYCQNRVAIAVKCVYRILRRSRRSPLLHVARVSLDTVLGIEDELRDGPTRIFNRQDQIGLLRKY